MKEFQKWVLISLHIIVALVGATFLLVTTFQSKATHEADMELERRERRQSIQDVLELHRSDVDRTEKYLLEMREDLKKILRNQKNGGDK